MLPVGKSLYSRAVLIDTGAFLAIANSADGHHNEAVECLSSIARYRLPLFVSIPTVYESHRRFLFDLGSDRAKQCVDEVLNGPINLIRTVAADEVQARALIDRYAALNLTLTDAANMAVMLRLGIAACFSFDRHYLAAGYIRVPPFHL